MSLYNRRSVTIPNAQPRNAVLERSERLLKAGTPFLEYPHGGYRHCPLGTPAAQDTLAQSSALKQGHNDPPLHVLRSKE